MFLLAFLLYPFIEIFVFVLVARATSLSLAFILTLATSLLGLVVARLQRHGPIFGSSGLSEKTLKNYLFGNLGAFALILPGFVTDVLGLLILVPATRNVLLALIKLCKIDLYGKANGNFSVFRTWSFDNNNYQNPYRQDVDASESGEYIDVESQSCQYDGRSTSDDEPIDVDFIPKD